MTVDNSLVAIFGATGTGKTTFVNDASGANLVVGHKSHACTQDVAQSPVFQVNGCNVILFDTPGFDDTQVSDTEILKRIGEFLANSYQNGKKLTGIIYLHRITDIRVGGISRRTFNVFRNLCGNDSLSNVLIVTNMWSDPPTQAQLDREEELRNHKDFFQPALEKGARMARRTHKTRESAHELLAMLVGREATTMAIQQELVDQKKDLSDTGAGQVVEHELRMAAEKHEAEMAKAKAEMEAALREQEERTRRELEEQRAKAKAEEERRAREMEEIERKIREEQEQRQKEFDLARAAQEAADRAKQEVEEALRRQWEQAEAHRRYLEERAAQLQRDLAHHHHHSGCLIA